MAGWLLWAGVAAVLLAGAAAQMWRPVAPPIGPVEDPSRWFDPDHLALVEAYWRPVHRLGLLALLVRVAVPCAIAWTAPGRRLVDAVIRRVGRQRPVLAAVVVAVSLVVVTDLILAPLAFWRGFVHEGAFGLRVDGPLGWARDWLVARAPTWVAVSVLVAGGFWLARRLPRTWPAVGGLAAAALTALVVFASPLVLEPLRFDTDPLADGPLRLEVDTLVARSGLRVDTVLVADASRRTTRHNAYVSGLGGSRRVVLYDTLLRDRPLGEVGMVIAHELGHERNADVLRGTLTGAAGSVLVALTIGAFVRWRVATGRQARATDPRGVAAVVALVVLLNAASLPVQSALSRRAEAAADLAALELTQDPSTYLAMNTELARSNLTHPSPPRWARWLWSSHPSTAERLTMGERWAGR